MKQGLPTKQGVSCCLASLNDVLSLIVVLSIAVLSLMILYLSPHTA